MRLGLIAGIRANAPALAAVLAALDEGGVERIIALGDLTGYHALPRETLALLRDRQVPSVAGDHDLMVLGRLSTDRCDARTRRAIAWTRQVLSDAETAQLAALPHAIRPGHGILCVHATVGDTTRGLETTAQFFAEAERLRREEPEIALCATGHAHRQGVHVVGTIVTTSDPVDEEIALSRLGLTFIAPGAVSDLEHGGAVAAFAIFDSQRWTVTLRRVPYDPAEVLRADAAAGLSERPRTSQVQVAR